VWACRINGFPLPPTPQIVLVDEDISTEDGAVTCSLITEGKSASLARTALRIIRILDRVPFP